MIQSFVEDRVISKDMWPSRSLQFNPCDPSVARYLKKRVFRNTQHTIDELKENITKY